MINQYSQIINSRDEEDFQETLTKIHLMEIFKCLLDEFPDAKTFKKVVQFVVWGYSPESEMLFVQGLSWDKLSKKIFDKSCLDECYFEQVALLKSENVQSAIHRWLRFSNDENFTQWATYRDLRRQMLSYSLSEMKKTSGEIDINAKMDAAKYSKELLVMMDDALQTFVQNHPKLKSSISALDKAAASMSRDNIMSAEKAFKRS